MERLAGMDIVQHDNVLRSRVSQVATVSNPLRVIRTSRHLADQHLQQQVFSELDLAVEGPAGEVDIWST